MHFAPFEVRSMSTASHGVILQAFLLVTSREFIRTHCKLQVYVGLVVCGSEPLVSWAWALELMMQLL